MASDHRNDETVKTSRIERSKCFSQQVGTLVLSEEFADVTFIIGQEDKPEDHIRLPGHRCILAARSTYFRALLFGGLSETNQKDIRLHVPPESFKIVLKYIYAGSLPTMTIKKSTIIEVLDLANQYDLDYLVTDVTNNLAKGLNITTVFGMLNTALFYNFVTLYEECLIFIDKNAEEVLFSDSFKNLTQSQVTDIIRRSSIMATEADIFKGVMAWHKHNATADIQPLLALVRFSMMTLNELLSVVRPTNAIPPMKLLTIIETVKCLKSSPYRMGFVKNKMSVPTDINYQMMMVGGHSRCVWQNRENTVFTNFALFKLPALTKVNFIKMEFVDINQIFSYIIEVSDNEKDWVRVADYSDYNCSSWQHIFFDWIRVQFVRVILVKGTSPNLTIGDLRIMYKSGGPVLVEGIIAPNFDVTTTEMGAEVIVGCGKHIVTGTNELIDQSTGVTSGGREKCISVRLAQPFYVNRIEFIMVDNACSFTVEISNDNEFWTIVRDNRKEMTLGKITCDFDQQPVTFIRIMCTKTKHELANIRMSELKCLLGT